MLNEVVIAEDAKARDGGQGGKQKASVRKGGIKIFAGRITKISRDHDGIALHAFEALDQRLGECGI